MIHTKTDVSSQAPLPFNLPSSCSNLECIYSRPQDLIVAAAFVIITVEKKKVYIIAVVLAATSSTFILPKYTNLYGLAYYSVSILTPLQVSSLFRGGRSLKKLTLILGDNEYGVLSTELELKYISTLTELVLVAGRYF